jgi:NAD+ diphosphatase
MRFHLFDAPEREASQFVGFAGNAIDRQSENRRDDDVETALADPACRVMVMGGGRMQLKKAGDGFSAWYDVDEARALDARLADAVLLGWDAAGPVVAAPAGREADDLPDAVKAIDYRSIYMQGLLDPAALGALAQGAAMLAWHHSHRFCSRCGAGSQMRDGGCKRTCPSCGADHFPRTDPVVIMLAVTRDACLMGRSPHFMPGMYSCLAGFVEPGETIENAVRRETFEEAGIRIGRVVYHASQPWPFPHSLMIGCYGEAVTETIDADATELEDCRWFSRAETRQIVNGLHPGGVLVPPKMAIAHTLIRAWADAEG